MISKNDIQGMITLIDAMAVRGAIKGEELVDIGMFRNRLVQALNEPDLTEQTDKQD